MRNVVIEVKGKQLVITVDLGAVGAPSKSGKTLVIASTEGNKRIDAAGVVVGLNVYKSREV
jgi:hypothetical protein